MPRRVPRTMLLTVIALTGLATLSPAAVADEPPPESAAPSTTTPSTTAIPTRFVTIDPSTDLVQGQTVRVLGTGFTPGVGVSIIQCADIDNPFAECAYGDVVDALADERGRIDAMLVVRRVLGSAGRATDCLDPPGCIVLARSLVDSPLASAVTPIRFDPDGPLPPPPVLTIRPSGKLAHNQIVTVRGSGFTPDTFVALVECARASDPLSGPCSFSVDDPQQTDSTGTFSASIAVKRVVGNRAGPTTDCLDGDGCTLQARVGDDPVTGFADVDLEFDRDAPFPRPPELTVNPDSDLLARQRVTVHGSGFAPNTSHRVVQCATSDGRISRSPCTFGTEVRTDEYGVIDTVTLARRFVPAFPEPINCASGSCVIATFTNEDSLSQATAPVTFDPAAPPPPMPSININPVEGLSEGAVITITGTDFFPGLDVGIAQCRGTDATGSACDISTIKFITVDANGAFTTDYTVRSVIRLNNEVVGCETAPGACGILAVTLAEADENSAVPLFFGRSAVPLQDGGGGALPAPIAPNVTPAPKLADTGTPVAGYLAFGAASLGLGVLLVLAGRRRRIRV